MKVSVCARITYYYTAEIPDDTTDYVTAADSEDPVYLDLCRTLHEKLGSDYEGEIVSVMDEEGDKYLYEGW